MTDDFKIYYINETAQSLGCDGMSAVLGVILLEDGRWIARIRETDKGVDVSDLMNLRDGGSQVAKSLGLHMSPMTFKSIRRCSGMTQSELADFVRISDKRTVRYWETGDRPVSGPVSLIMEYIDEGLIVPTFRRDLDQPKQVE